MLRASLWGLLVWAVGSGTTAALATNGDPTAATGSILVFGSLAMAALGGQWLARSGRVRTTAQLLVGLIYVGFTVVSAKWGVSLFLLYVLLVLITGLVLGRGAVLATGAVSVVTGLCTIAFPIVSVGPSAGAPLRWVGDALALVWAAWLLYLAVGRWCQPMPSMRIQEQEAGSLQTEDDRHARLAEVVRRNEHLRAVVKIAQDTAGLVDEDELLTRSAELVRRELYFDQVRIYFVDPTGEQLRLRAYAPANAGDVAPSERLVALGQDGMVSHAVRTGRPTSSSRQGEVAGYKEGVSEGGAQQMAFPLRVDGEPIGVVSLHCAPAQDFGPEDEVTLQLLVDQIAIAVRAARAFSLMQQRVMAARAEHRASAAEEWRKALRARRGLAVVRNERGLYQALNLWRPSMERVVARGEVAFGDPDQRVLLAPVAVRDQVIAVISARKPEDARPWSYQETALVKALCGQLGQALENARLYESVRQREEQAHLLGQATARMRESLDVETVLQVAADEIRHALGLAALDVHLQMGNEADG